jgi:hypothetical protein
MRLSCLSRPVLPIAAAVALSGCSATLPGVSGTAAAPDVAALAPKFSPADAPRPVGAPTEIYTRVARGILTCWFGPNGPLKPAYIYNAEADPPSKGGGAVIGIHQRDREASDPRSIRVWRLAIVPDTEGTKVEIENFKLPPEFAEPLARDSRRWAAGGEACGDMPVAAGKNGNNPASSAPSTVARKKPAAKPPPPR